jgi:hypothetical protein
MSAGTRIEARQAAPTAAAFLLVLAAVAGVAQLALDSGYFHTRDWQVAVGTVAAFLCGLCVTLGLRLLGRSLREPAGWLAVGVGTVAVVVLETGTWWLHGWYEHGETLGKIVATAAMTLIAAIVVAGARLLQREESRGGLVLVIAVTLSAAFVLALALADVWSVDPTSGDTGTAAGNVGGRLIGGAALIGVAAFLLISLVDDMPRLRFRGPLTEPDLEE